MVVPVPVMLLAGPPLHPPGLAGSSPGADAPPVTSDVHPARADQEVGERRKCRLSHRPCSRNRLTLHALNVEPHSERVLTVADGNLVTHDKLIEIGVRTKEGVHAEVHKARHPGPMFM